MDEALVRLERAYQEGNPDLIELNSEPVLDALRGEAKFVDLMRRVGPWPQAGQRCEVKQ